MNFKVDDEVWVDASEGHFGKYIYSETEVTRAKVVHIDVIYPSKMIVSHTRQYTKQQLEMSVVDAKYVFHKRGDLLKHRASRKNVKVGDLVAATRGGYTDEDKLLVGVVVKITKSYIHVQSETGTHRRTPTHCVVLSRKQENENV